MPTRSLVRLAALALVAGCLSPPADPDSSTTSTLPPQGATPTAPCEGEAPRGASSRPGVAVSNEPGAFSYSGRVAAGQGVEEFAWENPSSGALVSSSGQTATGSLTLTILDACGEEMYAETFAPSAQSASEETLRGTPGAWLIRIEMAAYTGQLSLSVTSG